jgi:hypothetical protein
VLLRNRRLVLVRRSGLVLVHRSGLVPVHNNGLVLVQQLVPSPALPGFVGSLGATTHCWSGC